VKQSTARTIRHYVELQARERPEATYLIAPETGRELTFGELRRQADNLSRFLLGCGYAPGDRIGFYCANGYQTAAVFLGTMYGGFVSVPLNLMSQASQLEYVLGHSGTRLVFTDAEHAPALAERVKAVGREIEIIVIDVDAPSLFLEGRLPECNVPAAKDADPALLMYTSGTTGRPKGCLLTQKNVVSGGVYVQQAHWLTPKDRVLSSLPLYHINGQIVATVGPLVHGGSVVAPHRFSASQFWELLDRYECTWFNVVPTIISYLAAAESPAAHPDRSARVRFGRSASAPLPPELHRAFERKFGLTIIETMGMTETAAPIFTNPLAQSARKYGSVGKPVGNAAKVLRLEGGRISGECRPGEIGELAVKGDNVMREYYANPEETAKAFDAGGWLRTGDLGYVDQEGYYFVTGRLKELIIKGGENIAPREIDDVLYMHPAVMDAAAVGIPDAHYGQEILCAVVLKPGIEASESDLRAFCEKELGRYKTPKVFKFMADLPKGPSGKVQRLKLLDA
jgi:acyl-CoA synthetase (AMP-forming)/AMP-acid ligase II